MAIELHKKLINKQIDAEPYFKRKIISDFEPKNSLVKRWLALNALLLRAAKAMFTRIVIVAVSIVVIRVFLKVCTHSIAFLSSPCTITNQIKEHLKSYYLNHGQIISVDYHFI
ncbi:hypothetical protein QL285_086512 [Trifolium repens]|nr:hypothetical protein QL285_086512 [Trifolium repens]